MKFLIFCASVMAISFQTSARSLQGVEFAETAQVEGKELVLNGVGLRKVQRFGLPIKVYVAGLYLTKKSTNNDEIVKSDEPKLLKMVFLRGVDREDLEKAWKDGVKSNCGGSDCEQANAKIQEFNKLMVDSKNKGTLNIQFLPEKVVVEMDGRSNSSGSVEGAAFSKTLLKVFIGSKPPTAEFKTGLLGSAK